MDYGVQLPLTASGGKPYSLEHLLEYTEAAERLGFQALSANDHLVHSRPWLDGPTALAAVLTRTKRMALATTVVLPVVRGPVAIAKTLAAIDILSGGRLLVGAGPGSSARDYAAVGVPFEERWNRFEEAVKALRALLSREGELFKGRYYSTEGIELEPYPRDEGGPPIWIAGWGSEAGLRRVARIGDGWFASGLHTTPQLFTKAWEFLQEHLSKIGKNPNRFPNALATMYFYVTEKRNEAEQVVRDHLSYLGRPESELCERLLVGSAEQCAEKIAADKVVGAHRIFLWPVTDRLRQLETFQKQVAALVRP